MSTGSTRRSRYPERAVVVLLEVLLGCVAACRANAGETELRAREALRAGEYARAAELYESALAARPDDGASQVGLVETLRLTGRHAEAARRADGFLAAQEASAGLHVERGRVAAATGDHAGAERHFRRAVALGGERWAEAVRELAGTLEAVGRRADARAEWQRLVDAVRRRQLRGSAALGSAAVAAWRLGYAQDAKDLFLDATSGPDAALRSLADFGYLFLEKYNATEAMNVFRDCLKVNKRYPPALIGMALAKQYESSGETEKLAGAALAVDPSLVDARVLLGELRVEEEDYAAALEEVRRALGVNPRDLAALSLEAVCRDFQGDREGFARAEAAVLAVNPGYGRFYHALAENLVARRKYREAVELERKAVALDPELWAAHCSLGMNLMRVGEVDEGRRAIEKAFQGDPFNVWAFNTLDLLDTMAGFVEARSPHFVARMAKEDAPVLSKLAPRLAEEAYAALTSKYGFTPNARQIVLEIFPDHAGFAVRTLGLPGLGALGVCFGDVIALDSPRARKPGQFNWGSTLWHELAHVITLEMTRHNVPRWFSEGISVYEERRARPGWGDDLTAGFVQAYKERKLLKVSELNAGMMRPKHPEQIGLAYYQASLVCELIEARFGFEKIREALRLFADNLPPEEVFRRTLGWDTARLDAEYARFVEGVVGPLAARLEFKRDAAGAPAAERTELEKRVARSPDDFFGRLELGLRLRRDHDPGAEQHLDRAAQLFPQFVEGGEPYQTLAAIRVEAGREEEALRTYVQWARYDQNAMAPLVRAAEIYQKRQDWAGVTRVLDLALFVHPYDADIYRQLAEAATRSRRWPEAIQALEIRLGLGPGDLAGAHLDLAEALEAAGRRPEAKRETLKALEIAPTFEKAQALLLRLSAGPP